MPNGYLGLGAVVLMAGLAVCPASAQSHGGKKHAPTPAPPPRPAADTGSTNHPPVVPRSYDAALDARASKLLGSTVYNSQDQPVGTLDDILIARNDKQPVRAVISVGGFLGIGNKLVEVNYGLLKFEPNNKVVLPNATKDELNAMQSFTYRSTDLNGPPSLNSAPAGGASQTAPAAKASSPGKS